ncbi:MAG: insulinase family protein, partial [Chloroflexaceae bacterium]|nr:insulinase family protein [Chloroflexaceae bacterium]
RELETFWRQHYGLGNTVISVAGNVQTAAVVAAVEAAFADYPPARKTPAQPTLPARPGPHLSLLPRDSEQGNFCIGFPALSYNDPDRRALQVLDTVVGGGMASRLFQELREERGLAYNIGSYHSELADSGMWVIYGSVEPEMLRDSVRTTLDILRDVVVNGVTDEELTLVKEQVKGGILLSLEDTWSVASRNGAHQLRYNSVIPVHRVVEEVEAVTGDDVLRVAQRLLRPNTIHMSLIGPYDEEDDRELRAMLKEGL